MSEAAAARGKKTKIKSNNIHILFFKINWPDEMRTTKNYVKIDNDHNAFFIYRTAQMIKLPERCNIIVSLSNKFVE